MDQVYESPNHEWLLVHSGLVTMGRHGRSGARDIVVIAQREREIEVIVGFSSTTPLKVEAAEWMRWIIGVLSS
jgi:hypothetical protein